jgi:hypothetical protein
MMSWSNYVLGTILLSPSDDNNNNLSGIFKEQGLDNDQPGHSCDWDCLTMQTIKDRAHDCFPKMAKERLSVSFASSHSRSQGVY